MDHDPSGAVGNPQGGLEKQAKINSIKAGVDLIKHFWSKFTRSFL
jgi:hypothetical protein